jgi:hypothetical protein
MKYYDLKVCGIIVAVAPVMHAYRATKINDVEVNDVLAVELVSEDGDSIAMLTVNLPEAFAAIDFPKNASFIDVNKCPWAIDFIKANDLGTITDWTWPSGFCTYPMCYFNTDKLNPYQPTIYDMGVEE